jgi:spermidine synthase
MAELPPAPPPPPPPLPTGNVWATESAGEETHCFRVKRVLFQGETEYADVEILDTFGYGKMLTIDGWTQSAQDDEALYHEGLVCPALVMLPEPARRVLVLGGGEGATLREALRFPSVERCVMVDIDDELVRLCREHMPEWSAGAFEDPRAEVVVGDARAYLEGMGDGETFDAIIADLPDGEVGEPLQDLYSVQFYELVKRRLSPRGIFVTQSVDALALGTPLIQTPAIHRTMKHAFGRAYVSARYIPSFWSEWTWVTAGPGLERPPASFTEEEVDARLAARRDARHPCRTYDGESHVHLFHLTRDLRDVLRFTGPVIEDRAVEAARGTARRPPGKK